jgi:hypothetical protein
MNAIRIFCCGSPVACMTKLYRPAGASGASLTKFSRRLITFSALSITADTSFLRMNSRTAVLVSRHTAYRKS